MKRTLSLVLSALLLFGMLSGCGTTSETGAEASTPGGTKKFSIGAAAVGGGFYNGASAISTVVNSMLDGYECTVEVTGASAANAMLTQAGEIEMAMCATETMYEAYNGIADFTNEKACPDIRAVLPGWGGVYFFITLAESGIDSLYELDGLPYSSGAPGTSTEIMTNRVFEVCGVEVDLNKLPPADAARAMQDGTLVGYSQSHPSPTVTELEATHELKILTIPDDKVEAFKEAYPQYVWNTIPGGYYKCLPEDTYNLGLYNMVIANVNTEEELVYQVVKACYENQDLIKSIFAQFGEEMALENLTFSTIPYHAGAIRYFNEVGVEVPEHLIPAECK